MENKDGLIYNLFNSIEVENKISNLKQVGTLKCYIKI